MLVRVFLFNKDLRSVAVRIEHSNDDIPYLESSSLYMESADSTAKRIARESFKVELDEARLKLVRQENSTVVNNGSCTVNNMATYAYEINDGEISLTGTKYLWVEVGQILSDLCDNNRYFEAAHLSEACDVL